MRIIQISDSHLSRDKPARAAELEACILHINGLRPQPDVVVHTGDIAHDGLVEDYEEAQRLLDRLSAPYFVLAGNRDDRSNLIKTFADGRHIRPDMDFIQYAVEDFATRLIMIDTVSVNSNKGGLCRARLEHIQRMLTIDAARPAVLFLHHPPFIVDVGPEPRNFEDWSEAEALIAELGKHDQLRGVFSGHVHRSFETAVGAVPAGIVSSVSSDIRWDRPNASNPDFPVFKAHYIPTEI